MAIMYRLRQDNRQCSRYPGHWFAHSVNLGTVELEEMAEIIQRNCTLKRSDVYAVIIEFTELVQQKLRDSHRVRLGGLGSLMVGIHGCGAPTAQDFTITDNIRGLHLTYIPDTDFLEDCEIREIPKYDRPR